MKIYNKIHISPETIRLTAIILNCTMPLVRKIKDMLGMVDRSAAKKSLNLEEEKADMATHIKHTLLHTTKEAKAAHPVANVWFGEEKTYQLSHHFACQSGHLP